MYSYHNKSYTDQIDKTLIGFLKITSQNSSLFHGISSNHYESFKKNYQKPPLYEHKLLASNIKYHLFFYFNLKNIYRSVMF